jgi:hypothetical protein
MVPMIRRSVEPLKIHMTRTSNEVSKIPSAVRLCLNFQIRMIMLKDTASPIATRVMLAP